jgi:hypothetical protein
MIRRDFFQLSHDSPRTKSKSPFPEPACHPLKWPSWRQIKWYFWWFQHRGHLGRRSVGEQREVWEKLPNVFSVLFLVSPYLLFLTFLWFQSPQSYLSIVHNSASCSVISVILSSTIFETHFQGTNKELKLSGLSASTSAESVANSLRMCGKSPLHSWRKCPKCSPWNSINYISAQPRKNANNLPHHQYHLHHI